jgi:hypothetical protein
MRSSLLQRKSSATRGKSSKRVITQKGNKKSLTTSTKLPHQLSPSDKASLRSTPDHSSTPLTHPHRSHSVINTGKTLTVRTFASKGRNNNNENNNDENSTTISFSKTDSQNDPYAYDPLSHASFEQLTGAKPHAALSQSKPTGPKKTKKQLMAEKKDQLERKLVDNLYGEYIDADDRGDGLVWAGSVVSDNNDGNSLTTETNGTSELALHEQILRLYLDNYEEQETRELQANFEGTVDQQVLDQGREKFLQNLVNVLTPKEYSRFIHHFRVCLQRLRTLLTRHQKAKEHLQANLHLYPNVDKQKAQIHESYQDDVQLAQISFFRQTAKLFGQHSDVFMPQLVIYLSSLTLTQLEQHRERQATSSMNLYSCGFFPQNTDSFRQEFMDHIIEHNPTVGTDHFIPPEQIPLQQYTFPVRLANKLYSGIDIYTSTDGAFFQTKLSRVHQRSHKVFVSNIPSTLTTRELMALFGNCGVLNAAEIYRDKINENSGVTLSPDSSPLPGDENLYQGLSLTRREALMQANAAALTIDISDVALGHFTSSFKTEQLLVPSHVVNGKLLQNTVDNKLLQNQMDSADTLFIEGSQDGFNDNVKEHFNADFQKFENLHSRRVARQQKKLLKEMQSEQQSEQQNDSGENSGQNSGENNDEQNNNNNNNTNTINEHNLPLANPINPLAIHQSPVDQLVNAFNFKKGSKSPTERFHVRDQHSPVYGFLYFATPDGKRRALKQALQVFGLSTASGYAITTQDASTKNQLVIAGLHRSMSSSDVAHFIKETLGNKMSLNKSISTINAVSTNASDQAHISQQYNSNVENHGDIKTSVIDRIYVPRSFARSFGGSDYFNNNRGYAIVTFDGHDTAFEAFSHLQNATIDLINPANKDQNGTKSVDKVERIDEQFDNESISNTFNQTRHDVDNNNNNNNNTPGSSTTSRVVSVHWRKEKAKKFKHQHPITSYFPTFARPKQHLFHKVSQQLKDALPQSVAQDSGIFTQEVVGTMNNNNYGDKM